MADGHSAGQIILQLYDNIVPSDTLNDRQKSAVCERLAVSELQTVDLCERLAVSELQTVDLCERLAVSELQTVDLVNLIRFIQIYSSLLQNCSESLCIGLHDARYI